MGLFDRSGNAAEWVDSCDGAACLLRGGSYTFAAAAARCDVTDATGDPTATYADVGFRCCTEP